MKIRRIFSIFLSLVALVLGFIFSGTFLGTGYFLMSFEFENIISLYILTIYGYVFYRLSLFKTIPLPITISSLVIIAIMNSCLPFLIISPNVDSYYFVKAGYILVLLLYFIYAIVKTSKKNDIPHFRIFNVFLWINTISMSLYLLVSFTFRYLVVIEPGVWRTLTQICSEVILFTSIIYGLYLIPVKLESKSVNDNIN